jgi:hypothetical protein
MYHSAETRIAPLTSVRRERVLPAPGEILVRTGDRVEPMQIVARTNLLGDFRIVPVARLLDVSASQIKPHLRVKPGDQVKRGQVIARRGRISVRTIKSPIDGVVTASGNGRVLIETSPTLFELPAYISGTVTHVLEPHGLVIETTGAVIQGVWGAGGGPSGETVGVLRCMVANPQELLRTIDVDISCRGMILVGGAGLTDPVIEQAEELQVQGIIVGGLAPELIPRVEKLPFPVIVTEGIGAAAMSEPVSQLLTTHDGREASISAHTQPRWPLMRPEIIIPLFAETLPPSQSQLGAPLTVGVRVRVVRAPYMGVIGTVRAIPAHPHRTDIGAKVYGVQVDVGEEMPVFMPVTNLEVLR